MSLLMLAVGMAFMLAWEPVVYHTHIWDTGDDLWGIFRAAHYVGWGFLGGVYTPSNGVISFPGLPVLLAPVAVLGDALHLSESDTLVRVAHPTVAWILQPVVLLLVSTVVFASDALAERLQVSRRHRILLCTLVAVMAWPMAAVWGHAEDALAMTFAMYAMVAMLDRKWSKAGWLFGLGIVMQPLVALMLPLFIGATPRGKRTPMAVRSAALSVLLVGVAFAGDPADTYQMLGKQPTQPAVNHATPWAALAPRLSSGVTPSAHAALNVAGTEIHRLYYVAAGPGRSIDIVIALLFGLYAWRRPQHSVRLLWLAAVVLASRCFFEAVMTPYYIAPPLFLALVMASRHGGKRFWAAGVIAFELTVFAFHHLNPWVWWLPIVAGLATVLALAHPGQSADGPQAGPADGAISEGVDVETGLPQVQGIDRSLEPAL